MSQRKTLLTARPALWLATAAVVGLGAAVAAYAGSPPFGDPKSVKYADALWKKMERADFVGDGAIKTVPYEGQHPHGAVLETLYGEVSVKGHTGELIVKRNYGGEGVTNAKVANNRAKYLGAVTVMFKRGSGYDPENNNWFWVKYKPDGSLATNPKGMKLAGRVAKGADKGCIACHSSQKDNDFQFNTTEFINK